MKRNQISALVLGLLLIVGTSCEDYLEKSPNGALTVTNYYKTGADALAAINASYTILFNFYVNKGAFEKDIISDDAFKAQGVDLAALSNFDNLNFIATDVVLSQLWGTYYKGIYNCNAVLDNVPAISMDQATKDRILGEAYFLRSYYYYNLVIRFGGVPLVKTTSDEKLPTRSSLQDTWAFIEDGLLKAVSKLPRKSEYSSNNVGRADKGAAQSLLGISYMFQQKWQEAYNNFKQVIDSGEYGLQPNFGDLFKPEFDNGVEVVFETQAKGGADFAYSNGFNYWVRPRNNSTIFGLGFCMPTQNLVNEFEPGDPRLRFTVIRPGDIISDEVKDYPFKAEWAPETGMNCGKYVVGIPVGNLAERHEQNQKNIRYAEVLLGYAEAAFRLGNLPEAVSKINLVRARARGTSLAVLPPVKVSDDVFAAIVHERRVELALEGKRYFDLVRWGLAEQKLGPKGYKSSRKGLLPIPQVERDVNPNLSQNDGY